MAGEAAAGAEHGGSGIAALLLDILDAEDAPRITLGGLVHGLGGRAFGVLMLILALPSCVPSLPGISTLVGVPIMALAVQLMAGLEEPWLPDWLRRRAFPRPHLRKAVTWSAPYLGRVERLTRARATWAANGPTRRLAGLVIFLLAGIMSLPIPVIGNMPPALTIALLSIGFAERDGALVLAGLAVSVVVTVLVSSLLGGLFWAAGQAVLQLVA